MNSAAEYRKRAHECVELAQRANAIDRIPLLQMAQAWLSLADQRAVEEADLASAEAPKAEAVPVS